MTEKTINPILRRMMNRDAPSPAEVPVTSSRAVRMAFTRAADTSIGLAINVSGLSEEVLPFDELVDALGSEFMLVRLERGSSVLGLAAIDTELRAAVIETQTMGKLRTVAATARPPTGTDAMLLEPLLNGFLQMLQKTTVKTDLDGWANDIVTGRKFESARAATLVLTDQDYRLIKLTLDLGVGGREAQLALLLPAGRQKAAVVSPAVPDSEDWATAFVKTVEAAPATLSVVLHNFKMPLQDANALEVGQLLALPGCSVSGVRLKAVDGRTIARGRLGQYAGMRALRITGDVGIAMAELMTLPVVKSPVDLIGPEAMGYGGLAAEPELLAPE